MYPCVAANTECVYVPGTGRKCLCYKLYTPVNATDPEIAGCTNTIPSMLFLVLRMYSSIYFAD